MVDSLKKWYRVELDKSGAILKCEEVERAEKDGRCVRYVEALDKREACQSAKQWYAARKAKQKECRERLHAERKAAGCCIQCTARPVPGGVRCRFHVEKKRQNDARYHAGEAKPRKIVTPEQALATYKNNHARVRLDLVLKQFDDLGPVLFRDWVVQELKKACG